ncbi:hypothetical protein KR093_006808 [Drosophila rubida]|uniref:BZIP domain-containing protein n=1 Tax=Drosophila rubida TaxID=30044 RepID=A0AAD4PI52_9MUSC|nr:hypothetical protein KR093_006808 [Drosophila rubida]
MKNLNGRAHNACYHPYYQQQLQQQRHQQLLQEQQHQQQQQQQQQQQHHQQQQQLQQQLPYAAQYNQLQQQQQLQEYNNQQYYNQQLQQQQEQLLRQQQQHQQQLPTLPTYQQQQQQQQQQHSKQSYGNSNNNNNAANMAMSARSNLHATAATATSNSNINRNGNNNSSNANTANANTATAAMAAMCQMQSFLNQQQQQQQQQQYNNNCAQINYNQHQQQQQQQQPELPTTNGDKLALDASEIANILASELFMQQLVSFDGMQSVPTLTTPTLTPTTLRTIEETIFELTSEPQNVPYQAGFKPPPLTTPVNSSSGGSNTGTPTSVSGSGTLTTVPNANPNLIVSQQQPQFDMISLNCSSVPGSDSDTSNGSWNDGQLNDDQSTTDTSSAATDSTSYQNGGMLGNGSNGVANNFTAAIAAANSSGGRNSVTGQAGSSNSNTSNSATPARRGGGRRPNKAANMSPEEEEKRRIRRERNKLAAARCRKRRVDQTNELSDEVEALQKKGEMLKKDIEKLTATKHQLEYVIKSHRPTCQKVRDDLLSVATCNGLIGPAALLSAGSCSGSSVHNNSNSNDSNDIGTITGFDATLNSTGRSNSPLDLKPVLTSEQILQHIKHEPQDGALESGSSLDQDGPTPAKRFALPNIATLNASLTTPTGPGSLNTPLGSAPPGSFSAFAGNTCNISSPMLNALNKLPKARPNTLNVQRPFAAHMAAGVDGKAPMQIQGVPIQTPSTGTFNFDSLMDGGTGLTPVSGPLVPTCSSQNKHPLELPTPTSEPSKLVSL